MSRLMSGEWGPASDALPPGIMWPSAAWRPALRRAAAAQLSCLLLSLSFAARGFSVRSASSIDGRWGVLDLRLLNVMWKGKATMAPCTGLHLQPSRCNEGCA